MHGTSWRVSPTCCIHCKHQTYPLRLRVVFAGLELEVTDK
jgi:hypothetical protein